MAVLIGDRTIDDIHNVLLASNNITKYDEAGNEEWNSDDLTYARTFDIYESFPMHIDEDPKLGSFEVMGRVIKVKYEVPSTESSWNCSECVI